MRHTLLYILLLIPTILLAQEKDSIFIDQFVKDSFTKYGIRNADSRGRVWRLAFLFMAIGFAMPAASQTLIVGSVWDAFLKTPLTKAQVSLLLAADSSVVVDSIYVRELYKDDVLKDAQFAYMLKPNHLYTNIFGVV